MLINILFKNESTYTKDGIINSMFIKPQIGM